MADSGHLPAIQVVVGLIQDSQGRYLVNRRRIGTHMAGRWEFPGGKRERDEDRFAALARELREELAIDVSAATPFMCLSHVYPDRRVELDIWLVRVIMGEPISNEGQEIRWLTVDELEHCGLLEADRPIIEKLRARASESRRNR